MKRRNVVAVLTLLVLAGVLPIFAAERPDPKVPQGENLDVPVGWKIRLDHPDHPAVISADKDEADIWFVNMTPGWHITTKPAAIFYHPASTASGNFRAETKIFLFDTEGRNEGYGLIFGGEDLEGDDQAYNYFLLRNSGEFLIKNRKGSETSVVQGWTSHESIRRWEGADSSTENVLAVECSDETVTFFVNGSEVASFPRAEIKTEGIVGLRMNHRVNVHVGDLTVTPLD